MSSALTPERRPARTISRKGPHLLILLMTLSLILSSLANPLPIEGHDNLLKPPVEQQDTNAVKASSAKNDAVKDVPITITNIRALPNNPIANAHPAAGGHPRPLSRLPSSSRFQPQAQDTKSQGKAQFKQFAVSPSQPQPDPQASTTSSTAPAAPQETDPLLPEHKYFHEPGYTETLSHYDSRFFRDVVSYSPHIIHLRHLIRSYLLMTSSRNLTTWLAHGTLLGWYWNGKVMPWDYDLDVQVSNKTLGEMGGEWNGTVWEYVYRVDGDEEALGEEEERVGRGVKGGKRGLGGVGGKMGVIKREGELEKKERGGRKEEEKREQKREQEGELRTKKYMLDVNPYWSQRTRLDGLNIIDARWIDMENGMYVDITGLSEDRLETAKQEGSGKGKGVGVWTDKNYHGYATTQIWPLRKTEFEGVEAWVPFDVEGVLEEEYGGKSLTAEEWAGHYFDHGRKEWVKTELVKKGA